MVRLVTFGSCISLVVLMNSQCLSQGENGLSLMEAMWANSDSIANYDVSYKHWIGFYPAEEKKPINLEHVSDCLTTGRIVVDRKAERILFVRERVMKLGSREENSLFCAGLHKGLETSFSDLDPYPVTSPRSLQRFYMVREVPVVERTVSWFPELLSNQTLDQIRDNEKRTYESSTVIRRQDGSSTVAAKFLNSSRYHYRISFDPVSSMPTSHGIDEYLPGSNTFVKNVSSGNPRFEKSKEIYRIVSIEYNKPESVARNLRVETVGTCVFTWHQFNEEKIHFPSDDGKVFGLQEAKKFVAFEEGEHSK